MILGVVLTGGSVSGGDTRGSLAVQQLSLHEAHGMVRA